jgi:hypothetical protein
MSLTSSKLAPRSATLGLVAASLLAAAPSLADKPTSVLKEARPVTVTVIPFDFDRGRPERKTFGRLIFRGGLILFATSPFFGGYSGLVIDPSGKQILAISDAGTWLRATLDYDGRNLKAVHQTIVGPILGKNGKPLREDRQRDAEGISLLKGNTGRGTAYVSFERDHRIQRYPFSAARFGPPNGSVSLPRAAKRMNSNQGLEALAVIRAGKLKGTLLAFSERLVGKGGALQGWLIGGPRPGQIALKRIGGFDITDAASLPDGGIILLERRFRFSEGVKMRIRRIRAKEIRRGALIAGETLFEAADIYNIDNMEGVAAHRSAAGETIITLISDDNFSAFQRTLLMQFALPDERAGRAGAKTR